MFVWFLPVAEYLQEEYWKKLTKYLVICVLRAMRLFVQSVPFVHKVPGFHHGFPLRSQREGASCCAADHLKCSLPFKGFNTEAGVL